MLFQTEMPMQQHDYWSKSHIFQETKISVGRQQLITGEDMVWQLEAGEGQMQQEKIEQD